MSAVSEEIKTFNDVLNACWTADSNGMVFVSSKSKVAIIFGGVTIQRNGNDCEIRHKGQLPGASRWQMSADYFSKGKGRNVDRALQDLQLCQEVGTDFLYRQYWEKDVIGQVNKKRFSHYGCYTFWYSPGTQDFRKIIVREEGGNLGTWLKVAINLPYHMYVTNWPPESECIYAKILEKSGTSKMTVLAVGYDSNNLECGATEYMDEQGLPDAGVENGPAREEDEDDEVYEVESVPGGLGTAAENADLVTTAACASSSNKPSPVSEAGGQTFPTKNENRNTLDIVSNDPNVSRANPMKDDPESEPEEKIKQGTSSPKRGMSARGGRGAKFVKMVALGRQQPSWQRTNLTFAASPAGVNHLITRLFPNMADTPAPSIYKAEGRGAGKNNNTQGNNSQASEADSTFTTVVPATQDGEEIPDIKEQASGEASETEEQADQQPMWSNFKDQKTCGVCGLDFEPVNANRNKYERGRISCNACEKVFHRNPMSICTQVVHSGDAWELLRHCNACHDKLSSKFKQFDSDRDYCNACKERRRHLEVNDNGDGHDEHDDGRDYYDHSVGEIEMVAQFSDNVRTLLVRTRGNETLLAAVTDLVKETQKTLEDAMGKLASIQSEISQINAAVAAGTDGDIKPGGEASGSGIRVQDPDEILGIRTDNPDDTTTEEEDGDEPVDNLAE